MDHFSIEYEQEKKDLKIFYNGKLMGGFIGPIAQKRYESLKAEMAKCDDMVKLAKRIINGTHKTKKKTL